MEPFNAKADGSFPPPQPRPAWVKDHIRLFNRKLEPRFREKKFKLMAQSAFAFYRGTDHLFWEDLGKSDLVDNFGGGKGTRIWISGDLHADNFGSFRDAAGRIVYDLNDFDESLLADHQYDLWRLGVSLVLLGREAKKGPKAVPAIVENMARGYWRELKSCRWYDNIRYSPWDEEQASGELRHFLGHARKDLGYEHMLKRWTQVDKDGLHFKFAGNPDLEALPKDAAQRLRKALNRYAEELKPWPVEKPNLFEILDLARRLNAGIGSEGHLRYYALLRVRDNGPDSYRILDIKQGIEPSAWPYLGKKIIRKTTKVCGSNQALRVEEAAKALSRHPDPWLGRLQLSGEDFLVRERSPFKGVLPPEKLDAGTAYQLGAILARAHCRARDSFAKKAFDNIKEDKKAFRKMITNFSVTYADQVESDYRSFCVNRG